MTPTVRNIIIFIAGTLIGILVNGGIVGIGPMIIDGPEGLPLPDPNVKMTMKESIALMNESMSVLRPIDFLMPFLAHAFGTLVAALIIGRFAASHHKKLCLGVGFFFFLGGFYMSLMLTNSPTWFKAVDLIFAYIPFALLGWYLSGKKA